MKVVIVSPYDLSVAGGVQVHVVALAAALGALGDRVHIVGPGPAGPGRSGLGASVAVPANGSRAPIGLDPRVVPRLRTVLRRLRPDVVHVHEPLVPLVGPAAVLAAGAPTVLTFHAAADAGPLPHLYRAVRGPGRLVVDRAAVLTAVSETAAAFHGRALGLDPERFTLVPNGVDVARFSRSASRAGEAAAAAASAPSVADAGRLVFLGRLEHRKGADVALRAFLRLAGERPALTLRVLGDGPDAGRLRSLLADAPVDVAQRVELLGRVLPDELPALLAAADVALLPSRGGESFGMVLLEAMASGVAVVATDIPGYRAVARHDREALLVPPDDPVALAAAVARVLDDAPLRARLRAAGTSRADEHDWSTIATRMQAVYRRAVASDPDAGGGAGRPVG